MSALLEGIHYRQPAAVGVPKNTGQFPCLDDERRYTGCIGLTLCSVRRCWNGQLLDLNGIAVEAR